jgi:FAD synthetase
LSDAAFRVRKYIDMLAKALKEAKATARPSREVGEILKLAELYLEDAKYYLGVEDYITSVSCVAYAEGLVDSLRMLGLAEFRWERSEVKKVVVAGTFDIVHPGHLYFLKKANEMGLTYVVVARDVNVAKNKGRLPIMSETDRLAVVNSLKPVYRAVLGDVADYLRPLLEIRPDIVLLGPDQQVDEKELAKELEKRGLSSVEILRIKERVNGYSSSQIIKRAAELSREPID